MRALIPDEIINSLKQTLEGKKEFSVLLDSIQSSESDLARADREGIIAEARRIYAAPSDDDIEIDDDAQMSYGDSGTWVQAWVFVRQDED